jgi:hypothetical protein
LRHWLLENVCQCIRIKRGAFCHRGNV